MGMTARKLPLLAGAESLRQYLAATVLPLLLLAATAPTGSAATPGTPDAGAPTAQTLDPAMEAMLAFAFDRKGLDKLRRKDTVARFKSIMPLKMGKPDEFGGVIIEGRSATGPIASISIVYEGPTFRDTEFELRTDSAPELYRILVARLQSRLGKPSYVDKEKDQPGVHWFLGTAWDINVGYNVKRPKVVQFGVNEYREPEESE